MRVFVFTALIAVLAMPLWAVTYSDTFSGTAINPALWTAGGSNGIQIYQNDELIISGTSTVGDWQAGGTAFSTFLLPTEGLSLSVDLRIVSGASHSWWAGIVLNSSNGNGLTYFIGGADIPLVGYTYWDNGIGYFNNSLGVNTGTRYGLTYSQGTVHFFVDNQEVGSQQLALSTVDVELASAVSWTGDAIDARFDNFTVNAVPEPSTLFALVSSVIGLVGFRLRNRLDRFAP